MDKLQLLQAVKDRRLTVAAANELLKQLKEDPKLFYAVQWEPQTPAAPSPATATATAAGRHVLIVRPDGDFGLATALRAALRGAAVTEVVLGQSDRQLAPGTVEIDCRSEQSFRAVLGSAGPLTTVLFLGALDERRREGLDELEAAQQRGVLSLFRLAQASAVAGLTKRPITLVVVTNDVYRVNPADSELRPDGASALGLARVIAREHPAWCVRCVDVSTSAIQAVDSRTTVATALAHGSEPLACDSAYRGTRWYRRVVRPLSLPPASGETLPLRRGGTYLIAGGAGGIGVELASQLLRRTGGTVVLAGRAPLDDRRRQMLDRVRAAGGDAIYLQADITDPAAMLRAVDTVHSKYGAIHGAVHAAIVHKDRALDGMDEATFRAALDPKVRGFAVLHDVLRSEPLDFLLALSSVNGVFGNPGQGNYAAGCAFKDAFALYLHHTCGLPVKTVDWGPWRDVGAVATPQYVDRLEKQGVHPIATAEGITALERVLAGPLAQVVAINANTDVLAGLGVDFGHAVRVNSGGGPAVFDDVVAVACAAALASERQLAEHEKALNTIGELGTIRVAKWLRASGAFGSGGSEARTIDDLVAQLGVIPKYRRFVVALADILERRGFLARSSRGDLFTLTASDRAIRTIGRGEEREAELSRRHRDLAPCITLVNTCVDSYPTVLSGKTPATSVLFPESSMSLVEGVYRGNKIADHFNRLVADVVRAAVARMGGGRPSGEPIRILEIGAGTGGTSVGVLEALSSFGSAIEYIYTDVSKGFTQFGRSKFGPAYPFVRFKVLDVEADPRPQGFAPGSIDIAFGSNVLHATKHLQPVLQHVQQMLRPRGIFVLNEVTSLQDFSTLTFGLLDGWWLFEDAADRLPHGPVTSAAAWTDLLGRTGMARTVAFGLPHQMWPDLSSSVIVCEASGAFTEVSGNAPVKIAAPAAESPTTAARPEAAAAVAAEVPVARVEAMLIDLLAAALGAAPSDVDRARSLADQGLDSILGVEFINRVNDTLGTKLKATALFDYPTVIELAAHLTAAAGPQIAATLQQAAAPPAPLADPDPTADAVPALSAAHRGAPAEHPRSERSPVPAGAAAAPASCRALRIAGPGAIQQIALASADVVEPGPDDVQIEVRAFALNFGDLLCATGFYPSMPDYPFTPGFELSGVVRRVGANVHGLVPGDDVIAATGKSMGAHAEIVTTDYRLVVKKPAGISFEDACSVPVAFLTASQVLEKAAVKRGETILIQTAAGGVGVIATQLALMRGAVVIGTAGSAAKLEYLATLGVQHRVNYRQEDFAARVMEITQGRGVDVVVNMLADAAIQKGIDVLASNGRYVELALAALQSSRGLSLARMTSNQSFHTHNSRWIVTHQPEVVADTLQQMATMLERGQVKPVVSRVFAFDDFQAAYQYLQDGRNTGKVVVSVPTRSVAEPAVAVAVYPTSDTPPVAAAAGPDTDIAIVGLSGKYPGARTVQEFWANLRDGRHAITEVPRDRWDAGAYYDPDPSAPGKTNSKWGGFVADVDRFDPLFFNISGKEAEAMDPQQRLFLEEAWTAIEDAGYSDKQLAAIRCGVFVGATTGDYINRIKASRPLDALTFLGNAPSILAARISYLLNLKGPSVAIDTACSSSLVALHLACRSIAAGECDMAIAGGVFVQTTSDFYVMASKAGMLSPRGRCSAFDNGADGFVPGEGVGAVVLKRRDAAVRDGDFIYGIVKGSGVNQDGRTNGMTAPSGLSQTELALGVYERAGIGADTISYVEAHGTGTSLGDPIEVDALTAAFRKSTARTQFCAIGSVKTNIGHAAAAAGIAGLTKVLLALQHAELPPTLNCTHENTRIDFAQSPFVVNRELRDWTVPAGTSRRAVVSSFGFSGTNAHVLIEEAPVQPRRAPDASGAPVLLTLSAKTLTALYERALHMRRWLESDGCAVDLADVGYTLNAGRTHHRIRTFVVAATVAEAIAALAKVRSAADLVQLRDAQIAGRAEASAPPSAEVERLVDVGTAYVHGKDIDWAELYSGARRRRLPLPAYPFERERYWIAERSQSERSVADQPKVAGEEMRIEQHGMQETNGGEQHSGGSTLREIAPVFLTRDWRREDLTNAAEARPTGRFIVFANPGQRPLLAALKQKGWNCIGIVDGAPYTCASADEYFLDFADAQQGAGAADAIAADRAAIAGVIDLSNLTPHGVDGGVAYAKIAALQSVIRRHKRGPLSLCHLTAGLQPFQADTAVNLRGADLVGLVKTIGAEYSQVKAKTIDVDEQWSSADAIDELLRVELANLNATGEICYRHGTRFVAHMKPVEPASSTRLTIDPAKVYVITGGTRGVGAEMARMLVEQGARQLVVMGAEPLPPRERWPALAVARDDAGSPVRQKIASIQALERAGARVETYFGRLDDETALRAYFDRIRAELGPIAGVIHSAMAPVSGAYFINKPIDDFRRHADVKISGTRALARSVADDRLDFFVLFSSVAAVVPSRAVMCTDYALANGFVDAFAAYQAAIGMTHMRAVNWVYWGDIGFSADEASRRRLARAGMYPNTPQEGTMAFARCVASPYPQMLFGRLGPNLLAEVGVTNAPVYDATGQDAEDAPAVAAAVRRTHAATAADVAQSLSGVDRVQECCHLLLLKTFRDAGVLGSAQDSWRVDDVKRQLRVTAAHERLFAALVDMLERAGFATVREGVLRATPRVKSPSVEAALARVDDFVRETAERYPEFAAHLEFVLVALRAYPDVLSGKRLATDVLFPRSSTRLVEAVYAGSRAAAHYHQLVASGVAAAVRARQSSGDRTGPIEILEVGAGTGSTTAFVLDAVRPQGDSLRYWYTDVSPTLLNYGSARFGERYPFVRFAKLDVEHVGDGPVPAGSIDIIVASNVLHASADLKATIAQLTSLMRPGGVLILNELMRTPEWATLTFGCLQGWWLSTDMQVRLPHSPLVNESTWAAVLRDAGFLTVDAVGALADRADYRQAVIVAAYGGAAAAASADVAALLRGLIAKELQIDPTRIDGATSFGEYGLDSIGMAPLVKRLESAFDISLNPAALLEHPTLDQLSEYMRGEYASAFAHGIRDAAPAPRPIDVPAGESPRSAPPEPRPAPRSAPGNDTSGSLAVLTRIFAAELNLPADRLDPDMPFGDFGIDSIVMGALVKRIESELALSLNPAALLEHPTLRALAGYLTHEYGDGVGDAAAALPTPVTNAPRAAAGDTADLIAVVGYSCRFPGAENADDFWTNLRSGVDSVGEVPSDRWNIADLYRPTPQAGKSTSKWGGFIDDVDRFDAGYFEIKEADAPHMDPLARLFLEQCALAVHHAGYERKTLWGRDVGVFVGARVSNYGARITNPTKSTLSGVSQNFVAAQVSHFFNFMGPSLVVDTACSSSLVSVHLACQSLRTGECEVAVAGGVEILLDESVYLLVSEARALSPDGKCHTFDERANGFVPGEGSGAVLLKRLSTALRDRDRIYGVIRSSVVNNDGHTMGITTPNIQAQKALVQKALSQSRIDPATITCVEAHGTGTFIGDPIELKALTTVFNSGTDDVGFCAVGCVKTNIGHLASAAGIAGLIKMLLALEHRALPPTLHCERPNPRFDFAKSPFYPNTTLKAWAPRHGVRRAGISAFGLGGTNAHVIVEEFDPSAFDQYAPAERCPPPVVFNRKRFWIDRPSAAADDHLSGCLMLEEAELVAS